jgi:hypothetical protein
LPAPTGAHDLGISLDPVAKPGVNPTLPRFQNHNQPHQPTTVKRAYDAIHKTAATQAANGETRVEKRARDRTAGEVEAWRKKAQADGGLFDLKKDSVKVIATTIAGNASLHRLTALQQALGDEIKAKS